MQIIYRVGYWPEGSMPSRRPDPLHPKMIDCNWFGQDKSATIQYLRSGHKHSSELGVSWCRFKCGEQDMGCYDLTDGVWYWPEGLHHYVDKHDLILPEVFLSHMRSNDYRVPEKADWIDWDYNRFLKEVKRDESLWIDWYHRRISS